MNKELEVMPVDNEKEVKNLAEKLDMIGPRVMNRMPDQTELEGSHIVITSPKGNGAIDSFDLNGYEIVPINKEKKYELMTIGEEGSTILRVDQGKQLLALSEGSVVVSSKFQPDKLLNQYEVSTFSMDDVAAGNIFDPYCSFIQMLYRNAMERMREKDWKPKPRKSNFFLDLVDNLEEEMAMSLMEPRILERMASLVRSSNITAGIVVQTIDSVKGAYTYEVKAPVTDKKRFRLWLRLVFRDKGRKKLVVTNQEELSANHHQLLEAALEKTKEKPFLLDEFHQTGGVKGEKEYH